MTTKSGKTPPGEALLDQALEFIAQAPEEQFLQYLTESGENPQELSQMTAEAIESAIKAFGQKQLVAARKKQERKLAEMEALRQRIKTYGDNPRAAFTHMVSEAENAGYEVSLQYRQRNLDEVNDEELQAMMLALLALLESQKGEKKP